MKINNWNLKSENFGPLQTYVEDDMVTDINFDGKTVWVDDLRKGKYNTYLKLEQSFLNQFCTRISNVVSQNFNKFDNVLEAETDVLRISIIHESVANNGTAISIRKTPAVCRLSRQMIKQTKYCKEEVIEFLIACVRAHANIVFCGLPGSGKTELLKFLTRYIPMEEKVITIEDNLEIHFSAINPNHHCVELKVNEDMLSHTKAIKVSLRQNAEWILLSEARSGEVKYLLESFSTGLHGLTTLHTDDVRKIPERILNMMKDNYAATRLENDVYAFINIGVLIRKKLNADNRIIRYIDQVCIFDRSDNLNSCIMVVENGQLLEFDLPYYLKKRMELYEVEKRW